MGPKTCAFAAVDVREDSQHNLQGCPILGLPTSLSLLSLRLLTPHLGQLDKPSPSAYRPCDAGASTRAEGIRERVSLHYYKTNTLFGATVRLHVHLHWNSPPSTPTNECLAPHRTFATQAASLPFTLDVRDLGLKEPARASPNQRRKKCRHGKEKRKPLSLEPAMKLKSRAPFPFAHITFTSSSTTSHVSSSVT